MANRCSKMYGTDPLQHRIYLFIVTKKAKCCSGDVIYASVLYYNIYRKQSKSFNSLCNISICRPVVDVSVDFSLMKRYQTTCLFCFVFLHYTRYQEDFPSCKTIKRDAMTTALLDGSLKAMTKNRQEQEQKWCRNDA